ncbi:MAG: hypothetical protein GY953_37665 [bacterium]|nr:hypothetical protein [bacterium]
MKLLLHEMWLSDSEAESAAAAGHSYLSGVASLARQAGVGALMLVHHHPKRTTAEVEMLAREAEKLAGIPTSFGEEGRVVEID